MGFRLTPRPLVGNLERRRGWEEGFIDANFSPAKRGPTKCGETASGRHAESEVAVDFGAWPQRLVPWDAFKSHQAIWHFE